MNELIDIFTNVVKNNYFNPNGRARRREYWMFALASIILFAAVCIVFGILSAIADFFAVIGIIVYSALALGLILPNISLTIRRLHDVDKSGWWLLIGLIPFFGGLILLYFYVTAGTVGTNQFGPDPKA